MLTISTSWRWRLSQQCVHPCRRVVPFVCVLFAPSASCPKQVFDKDQRGFIEAKELRHVLTNIGEKLSGPEMEDMIKEADPDNDGKIQYEEFVRLLLAR